MFANGAVTGAFSRALNDDAASGNGKERDLSITDEQRQLVADGKIGEFWVSRQAAGDPVARAALRSLGISVGLIDKIPVVNRVFDQLFGGTSINRRLLAYDRVYGSGSLDIGQLRIDLARAHINAVSGDKLGVQGLLNPEQIARYHHRVFGGYSLPTTAFGGTPLTGTIQEANYYRLIWCGGCDT